MCLFVSNQFRSDRVLTRRERSKVPLIVRQCVEEIERRGMEEVGIYRVSGVATDIQALKAAFDSSELSLNLIYFQKWFGKCGEKHSWEGRDASHVDNTKDRALQDWLILCSEVTFKAYCSTCLQYSLVFIDCCLICCTDNKDVSVMMREMDVNAIAGTLKLYFRELPEPLFTDELYPNFAGGIGQSIVVYFCIIFIGSEGIAAVKSCDTGTFMCAFAFQLCLTVWPRRAACSTCCCLYQSPTWSPSSSCLTT